MDTKQLIEIETRASHYSFEGVFVPSEQMQDESIAQLIRDRLFLIDYIYEIGGRATRRHTRAEQLQKRLSLAMKQGADNLAELEHVRKLLVASASILPYRKNKAAQAIQSAIIKYLVDVGLERELESAQTKMEAARTKRKKPREGYLTKTNPNVTQVEDNHHG